MREKARVIQLNPDNTVLIIPLITDACINCTDSSCAKHGKPFVVFNGKHLPVQVGSVVTVKANLWSQVTQAIVSLLVPVACAVLGYFASGYFYGIAHIPPVPELWRVCGVLTGFLLAVILVVISSRLLKKKEFAQIVAVEY